MRGEKGKTFVEVIQYLRPDGRRRRMLANVGEETAKLAENMVLSAEELIDGTVVVYARFKDEPPELERIALAHNRPGPRSPTNVLMEVIGEKAKERKNS